MVSIKERIISLLAAAGMLLSLFPQGIVYAAEGQEKGEPAAQADLNVETDLTVSVDYSDAERSEAKITYKKHGVKADNANLLYLGDTSVNGKESFIAATRMLQDNGLSYIFDYGSSPLARGITYQNNVMTNTGWISSKAVAISALKNTLNPGNGTPDEVKALQAVQAAIDELPAERLQYPTIVFWTLGGEFGNKDNGAIEAELKKLKDKLDAIARDNGVDTGFMTFQYGDVPNELLQKYVSKQGFAHSNDTVPAAYAANTDFDLRHIMAERLEQAVHEHYHKINLDFNLNNVPIAERITAVNHSAVTAGARVITDISDDGKNLNVQIERLCRQIDVSITITVKLNTNETGTATVFNEQYVSMGNGQNGMHTGIFDEKPVYGNDWHIYAADVSRENGKIKFTKDGNANIMGDLPADATQMPGTRYVIPGRGNLTNEGKDFGGWIALDGELAGKVLHEGTIINFPHGEVTLKPIWGTVAVEKRIEGTGTATMLPNKARNSFSNFPGVSYANLKTITILNSLPTYNTVADANDLRRVNVPGAVYARDIGKKIADGAAEDSTVIAYAIQQGNEFTLYIAGEGGITVEDSYFFASPSAFTDPLQSVQTINLNGNLHLQGDGAVGLFYGHAGNNIRTIDAETIDMSNITNASQMFYGCRRLPRLNIGGWDVSNVTDMNHMFYDCGIQEIDINSWDVSNVTNIAGMFKWCYYLKSLDLSGWDTSNVTNMSETFHMTHSAFVNNHLQSLNIKGWNTSKVTNMSYMFGHCNNLTELDVSSFDTRNVTNMSKMFSDCGGLKSLDLSSFDVSRVTDMNGMFDMYYTGAYSLKSIDGISGWNVSSVKNMGAMFRNCFALQNLDIGSWDVRNVTSMSYMFNGCKALQNLDIGSWRWNANEIKSISNMFSGCAALKTLDIGSWDVREVTNMESVFNGCTALQNLNIGSWNVNKVTNMNFMFGNCSSLRELDLSSWQPAANVALAQIFRGCKNLTKLDIRNLGKNGVSIIEHAFGNVGSDSSGCVLNTGIVDLKDGSMSMKNLFNGSNIANIDLSGWKGLSNVNDMSNMFNGAKVRNITFGGEWATTTFGNLSSMSYMFHKCTELQSINMSGWNLPNLTNTSYMFAYCNSLQNLNLSWRGIRQTNANNFTITNMFAGCPRGALTITNTADSQAALKKVANEYKTVTGGSVSGGIAVNSVMDADEPQADEATSPLTKAIKKAAKKAMEETAEKGDTSSESTTVQDGKTENTVKDDAETKVTETPEKVTGGDAKKDDKDNGNTVTKDETAKQESSDNNQSAAQLYEEKTDKKEEATDKKTAVQTLKDVMTKVTTKASSSALSSDVPKASGSSSSNQKTTAATNKTTDKSSGSISAAARTTAREKTTAVKKAKTTVLTAAMTEITKTIEESPKTAAKAAASMDGEKEQTSEDEDPEPPESKLTTAARQIKASIGANANSDENKSLHKEADSKDSKEQMEKEEQRQNNENRINNLAKIVENRAASQGARAVTNYPDHWNNNDNLQVKEEMVALNPADKADVEYTVIVKYVGDNGASSGVIELNDPISSDITIDESSIVVHRAEPVPGTASGYVGGRVIETPHVVNVNGVNYLRGRFDSMYASSQIRVTFKCTVSKTDGVTKKSGDYYYWDNTAYATSLGSSDTSKTNRLWWVDVTNPTPDPGDEKFILNYRYEGNVPAGVMLPANEEYKEGDIVTLAATPTPPRGYIFEGWFVDGAVQTGITMPANNVTAVGRWSIDDATMPKIKFKYAYTGNVPNGAPVIGDTGAGADIPAEQEVQVGGRYILVQITSDSGYHKFNGWTPSLSVNGVNIPGTVDANGNYSFANGGKNYVINIAGGTVNTSEFVDLDDVEITFTGSWMPYKGTIRFDANGGEANVPMADMTDVEWNTTKTLTTNSFTNTDYQFVGWSMYPNGDVIKADGAVADGLIKNDGDVVTLYAIWNRSEYEVRYDLSNVTSDNMASKVNFGDVYEAILSADNSLGYYLDEAVVEITMNYGPVTQAAYDPATGRIRINNVIGDILIKAYIPNESKTPAGVIEGNRNITLSENISNNQTTLTVKLSEPSPIRGTLTYQWQRFNGKTWENVPGQTNVSINLTGLTMADHGAQYRCVVTYTQGMKTPATAIIEPAVLAINKVDKPVGPTTMPTEKPNEPVDPTEKPIEPTNPSEKPIVPTDPTKPNENPWEPTNPTINQEEPRNPLNPGVLGTNKNEDVFTWGSYFPRTGDISSITILIVCMGLSLVGILAFLIVKKKTRKK